MRIVVVLLVIPTSAAAAGALVVLLDDRRADALDLLLLLLDLLRVGLRVARQPVLPILDGIVDCLLLVLVHLLPEALVLARTLNRGLHGVDVSVESIARVDALLRQLVFLRNSSASRIIFSISSSVNRPLSFVIVIFSALPVPLSSAPTLRIPFESISKVTSICGWPRGA